MRAALVSLLFLVLALSGCSDGGGKVGGGSGVDDPDPVVDGGVVALRFAAEDRAVITDSFTVTVGPEDACAPAGCPLHVAAGGEQPDFIKTIDISDAFPQGMHAFVEVRAVYEPHESDAVDALGNWNLQWSGRGLWVSGADGDNAAGNASASAFVTNHGPEPAELVLVILEPDGGAEETEVTIHVRVTPLDDAVHRTHVVGVPLGGGAVPVTTELVGEGVLQVRGPDDGVVLTEPVENGTTVTLPADSPPGEHRFVVFDADATTRFLVPEANLTAPLVRLLDTTPEDGEERALPASGPLAWEVDLQRTPYLFRIRFDGSDGRSSQLDVRVTVTNPNGTAVIDSTLSCDVCLYSLMSTGTLAHDALVAGTYTVTIEVETAVGWRVSESVGLYGR